MKTSLIRSLVSTVTAVTCVAGFLLVPAAVLAAAPSIVADSQAPFIVTVSVPSDGDAVTYMLNGESVTVNSGETAVLPAGAQKIYLPEGTIFVLSPKPYDSGSKGGIPSAKGGLPSSNSYTVIQPVTLPFLSSEALRANSGAFTLTGQTGDIKLPSGEMIDLINEIRRVAQTSQGAQTPAVSDDND